MPAVGTVTITYERTRTVGRVIFDWLSDGAGAVSGTTSDNISGELLRVVFDPDATDAPDDNYDVTLLDESGVDVLQGGGADRDTATSENIYPGIYRTVTVGAVDYPVFGPCAVDDKLQLVIANAGAANKGRVILYYR